MTPLVSLNLLVLRSPDMSRAVAFYTALGLTFRQHRHGHGPDHFAAELPGGVFEIYPEIPDGPSTRGARVGFAVPSINAAISALGDRPELIVSSPKDSPWGRRAVLSDPDGHRVELLEMPPSADKG